MATSASATTLSGRPEIWLALRRRAKGLLMEREGLSEQDAFARLRKASQISGRPLKVVADALIATLDST